MSVINKARVRAYLANRDKRCSKSFLAALDLEVRTLISGSAKASNHKKTVLDVDLYAVKRARAISKEGGGQEMKFAIDLGIAKQNYTNYLMSGCTGSEVLQILQDVVQDLKSDTTRPPEILSKKALVSSIVTILSNHYPNNLISVHGPSAKGKRANVVRGNR